MPKRTTTKRFVTSDVQGKGSFVILRSLRVGERRSIVKESDDEDFSMLETSVQLFVDHVVDWNWVGDDGEPLPLPKDDEKVIDELTDPESELLANLLFSYEAKNSKSKSPKSSG